MAQKKKYTPPIITGKTGDEIIAERKAKAQFGAGAYPTGDDIIAQRKAAVMPKIEWQDIQRQERELLGGSEDFTHQMAQDAYPPQSAAVEQKPVSEIRPYTPSFMDRLKALAGTANEKIKAFLYGAGSMAGGDALSRAAESLIEKDIKRDVERTGDDTLLKMYRSDREYWNDERQFNRWLGRKLDTEISAADKFARGAGEVVGEIAEIALLSELTAPLKIYQGTSKVLNILGRMPQMATIGAVMGAEGAYGAGGNSEQVLREALKSAGFFSVGGAVADIAGLKMLNQLKPIYEKYPQYRVLLNAALGASRGMAFGLAGIGTEAGLSKVMGEKPPSLEEVIKTGLALAGAEAFLSMLTGTPFRRGMTAYESFRAGEARIPFDENLTAKNLKKNGYVEFKKGTGIWIKTDPTTGAQIDMQREMVNINGNAVFKSDIYLTEKKIGRKLSPKELARGAKDPNYFRTLRGERPVETTAKEQAKPEPAASNVPQETRLLPGQQEPGGVTVAGGAKPSAPGGWIIETPAAEAFNQPPEVGENIIEERKANKFNTARFGEIELIKSSPQDKNLLTFKTKKGSILKLGPKAFEKALVEKPEDIMPDKYDEKTKIKIITDHYGRAGKSSFEKEVAAIGLSPDSSDWNDFVAFFEKYYNAGLEGKQMPSITIHPQQAHEFYNAGRKDSAKNKIVSQINDKNKTNKQVIKQAKTPAQYGPAGNKVFKKWAANEWVNADLSKPNDPYTKDYRAFFEAYYNAGKEGKRIIDVKLPSMDNTFPAFLEQVFYNAGVNDAKADTTLKQGKQAVKVVSDEAQKTDKIESKEEAAEKQIERDLTNRELLEEVKNLIAKSKEGEGGEQGEKQEGRVRGPVAQEPSEVRADGEGALEGVPPENVRRTEEDRETARGPAERAKQDATGDGGLNRAGSRLPDSLGDREGEIHPATERGGQAPSVKDAVKKEVAKITADPRGQNAVIEGEIELGGDKQRARDNIEAIRLVKKLESENRPATPEEQAVLLKYVGWGGLSNVTYKNYYGQPHREWADEHNALKELVTEEEWRSIRESTTNAHYTSISVIKAMYNGLEKFGFKGGKILEPALGIGHFLGAIPAKFRGKVSFTGVELDKLTGAIAKKLYPLANIHVKGFEETNLPDNYFDVAISNVPFGNYGVVDKKYPDYVTGSIHNYFFAKALDKVRPGGIVMFITSRYTLDSTTGARFRSYLAERADFLGAVRLPNTAFKSNARTEVVTDIIILKKRPQGLKPAGEQFLKTEKFKLKNKYGYDVEVDVNEYFAKHPEMILGKPMATGSMYRANEFTVEPGDTPLPSALANAFSKIDGQIDYPDKMAEIKDRMETSIPAPEDIKQGAFTLLHNGKLYVKQGEQLVPYTCGKMAEARIKGLMAIRDEVRRNMRLQITEAPEKDIQKSRERLNKLYDNFVKEYGILHSKANELAFGNDPDYYLLMSLENYSPETEKASKAAIFYKNTITPYKKAVKADTAKEALIISLNETGGVNMARMEQLTGRKESELVKELEGLIFKTAEGTYETAEKYLSGNVRQKLRDAEALVEIDPSYRANVEALKKVQPKDLDKNDIKIQFGASWIPTEVYIDFFAHIFNVTKDAFTINYTPEVGAWSVTFDSFARNRPENISVWGTPRVNATKIIEKLLNNRNIIVTHKKVINKQETLAAQEKAEKIKDEFAKWLWSDPEREKALVELYNEKFNNIRLVEYDGSHLDLPGSNPAITFREHQKNAIWRIISSGGNTLLAHGVGAGKSGAMFGAAMELRRMGIIKKPMMVFPNHLVPQMGEEFLKFYPGANILVATKKDFIAKNRKEFLNKIATGDYDAVLVGQSQFGMISMSEAAIREFYQEQIDILESFIKAEVQSGRRSKRSATEKNIANAIKRLKTKMKEETEKLKKDVSVVTFEELGVDALFVDEAHDFKNLMYTSNMQNVSGLGDQDGSAKAFDLYMKVRYLQRLNGGRGVVFATATPVMNTMAEMYTMQRYLQGDLLKQRGLDHFDAWARAFGQVQTVLEMTPEGKGFRQKQAFSRFINVGELVQMFRSFADVLVEVPGLKVPLLKGGKMQVVLAEPSKELLAFIDTLAERADMVRKGNVDPSEDNLLKITGEGRKAALDMRLIDPSLPDDPNSKVNIAIQNIYEKWLESKDDRLTQVVFLDLSTPKGRSKKNKNAEAEEDEAVGKEELRVYDEIKRKLVLKGIPEKEIAFIHDAKSDVQKLRLFENMNKGNVRILIGSTGKMGTGMNVQTKLKYMHHLDCPWRPGDIEQRNGRIIRQGNENEEVEIYVYNTERSFDARMWDTLTRKQKFIQQVMTSGVDVREAEDIGEIVLSFQEIAAITSGNPLIQEQVSNEAEVNKLLSLKQSYYNEQRRLQVMLDNNKVEQRALEHKINGYKADLKARKDMSGDKFVVRLGDATYTDRKMAGEKIVAIHKERYRELNDENNYIKIGSFAGFDLYLSRTATLVAKGAATNYEVALSNDGPAMFRGLTTIINNIEKELERCEERLERLRIDEKKLESQIGLPFEHEERLKKALQRKAEIEHLLNPGDDIPPIIDEEVEEGVDDTEDTESMPAFIEKPQRISSAATSINVNKLPAVFNKVKFKPGTVNADLGGGKFDNATEFLAAQGVENIIWDPYNRTPEHNAWAVSRIQGGQADTATISNVLNVIEEEEARLQVIENAADVIKPDGVAYFSIYEGDGSGIGKETPKGYQLNRKTKDYVPEIRKFFRNVIIKNGIIEARDPIKENVTEALTSPRSQNYLGPASGKNTSGKAKRASEIVKDFENRLEMAIKKGGLHWSKLGEFNNRTHIIRIAKANDIPTLAHEAGHYLDRLYFLTDWHAIKSRLGKGEEAEKVIDTLMRLGEKTSKKSYSTAKQRREGIAEFIREYLTNTEKAVEEYPELNRYFRDYVPQDVLTVLEDIAKDISDLVNLDPVSRGMKAIWFKGDPRYPTPLDLPRKLRQLYTGLVDATYPVEWAAKELGGRIFADAIANELSCLRGWEGIALADINPGGELGYYQSDLDGKKVGPSYFDITKDIHKNEQTRREFWVYSVARRAKDYVRRGLELPDSPETYEAQARILELRHPEFKEIFDNLREYRSNLLDLLVQSGIYSELDKAKIELANPNYVSLKRIKEAFDYVAGTSQKLGAAKRVVKRLKGGGEDIMDPEENDINNTFIYRSVAMRNKLLLELADMADKVEGTGKIMAKSPQKVQPVQFNLEKVKKYLYDVFDGMEGIEKEYGDAKQFVDSLDLNTLARIFNPQYLAGPNQVVVYRDGKPELYDVHPDLYEAIKGLTPENTSLVTETLMKMAQLQKTGIIYTPQFIYRNAARDTFHNLVSSDTHLNPVDIFLGFYSVLKGDKWYRLAARKGGTTNYFTANDRQFAQEAIDQIMANGNRAHEFVLKLNEAWGLAKQGYIGQGLWAGFKSFGVPLRLLQDWIEPGEMAGRVAEMKKSLVKYLETAGYSDEDIAAMNDQKLLEVIPQDEFARAIARGRNLSVDFRKMGKWIKRAQLNRLINFLNPSIQGTVNVGRLLVNHPWRTIAKGLLYITIPTLFNLWLNWENKNYRELPWWRRDFFWNIPIGDPKTTRWFFPVPRPWELGILFGALPERLAEAYLVKNPNAWKEFDNSIRDAVVPEILPSAIEPFYRDATGKDWRGYPILTEADKRVSPYLQYNDYTSLVTIKIAEVLKDVPGVPDVFKSPKRFQRIIEGYLGTLGRTALESIDITLGKKEGMPIISQGFVVDAYRTSQSVRDFYDYKAILETQYADAKRLGEKLPDDVAAVRKVFYAASDAMNILEDAIQAIERSDRPNKTLEAAGLRAEMIELAEAANKMYQKAFIARISAAK